jgi:hypothetical protein
MLESVGSTGNSAPVYTTPTTAERGQVALQTQVREYTNNPGERIAFTLDGATAAECQPEGCTSTCQVWLLRQRFSSIGDALHEPFLLVGEGLA